MRTLFVAGYPRTVPANWLAPLINFPHSLDISMHIFPVEVKKILDQVALTERGLRELNNLQRGELKLGSSLTIGNYWLPQKISQFQHQYPGIFVNCTLANTEEICIGTATGRFDLGLIEGEVKPDLETSLEQEIIGQDLVLMNILVLPESFPFYLRYTDFLRKKLKEKYFSFYFY